MGRWTQYDEDEYRLPEGMKRVGYDADTQKYSYVDQNGDFWEGSEGQEFGELRRVGEPCSTTADLEASAPTRADGYQPLNAGNAHTLAARNREAWRHLLPFFLIICVILLLVFRLFNPSILKPSPMTCPEHNRPYEIKPGDTCWEIAKDYGTSVDSLRVANPSLDCSALQPGVKICVPVAD